MAKATKILIPIFLFSLSACGGGSDGPPITLSFSVQNAVQINEMESLTLPLLISYNGDEQIRVKTEAIVLAQDSVKKSLLIAKSASDSVELVASEMTEAETDMETFRITVTAGNLSKTSNVTVTIENRSLIDAIAKLQPAFSEMEGALSSFSMDDITAVLARYIEQARYLSVIPYDEYDERINSLIMTSEAIELSTASFLAELTPYQTPATDEEALAYLHMVDSEIPLLINTALIQLVQSTELFEIGESFNTIEDFGLPVLVANGIHLNANTFSYIIGNNAYGENTNTGFVFSERYRLFDVVLNSTAPCSAE